MIATDKVVLETAGSCCSCHGIYPTWRKAHIHLTDRALRLCHPVFKEVVFETELPRIRSLAVAANDPLAARDRTELRLLLEGGNVVRFRARDVVGLGVAIQMQMAALGLNCRLLGAGDGLLGGTPWA